MDEELQRLQGTWNIVFLEVEGMTPAPNVYAGASIEVKGDRFTTRAMGAVYAGTISLDAESVPNKLQMKFTEGPEKGNTNNGIYELEGDRWRFCVNMKGGPAPTEFVTSPGSGRALETLNREKRE
jgi:uncharacterized protein (TIGR03067 family)